MKRFICLALICSATLIGAATDCRAAVVTFDFEGIANTALPRTGALTMLSDTQSGLTVDITRPGSSFDVVANTGTQTKAAEFGLRSLDPFFAETSNTPFFADFSTPLLALSVDYGDYGSDTDTLSLQVFSGAGGTGLLLGSAIAVLPGGGSAFSFQTLSVSSAIPFLSARIIGGSASFPNSIFIDNLQATTVPEPTSLALLGMTAAGFCGVRIRRRRTSQTADTTQAA